jgi:predicted hydrolase (HD superfamily)
MVEHRRAMDVVPSVAEARALARELLEPLGNRWAHVQAVAARAEELRPAVEDEADQHLLVVAAWWHDLGYASKLRRTGCHQIDGARYLTSRRYPSRLCALVAHHSAATFEARERGLLDQLNAWHLEEGPVADALWMADMTTGPAGQRLEYPDRLAEILQRYEPDSVVYRAMRDAEPAIRAAISRTEQRLAAVHAI